MNQSFVRDLIAVPTAIAVLTAIALAVSSRQLPPRGVKPVAELGPARSPEALGARLYAAKGCATCHSIDGTPRIGPSFLHDYGSRVTLSTGEVVAMDDAYIRESVLSPRAKARPGYPDSMPSFDGMLKPRELDGIVAYLKSLR